MGIKAKFKQSDVQAYIDRKLFLIDKAIIGKLHVLGLKFVNHARQLDTYVDDTGNLRNSIGYVIVKNGVILDRNFEKTSVRPGKQGQASGQSLAELLASKYSKGYALIVVAGMNYAATVESRGKDVISSAEQLAKTEFPRMVSQLKQTIKNMR